MNMWVICGRHDLYICISAFCIPLSVYTRTYVCMYAVALDERAPDRQRVRAAERCWREGGGLADAVGGQEIGGEGGMERGTERSSLNGISCGLSGGGVGMLCSCERGSVEVQDPQRRPGKKEEIIGHDHENE